MTQALSAGFCLYSHTSEPLGALDELRATQETLWQNPVLQVLDMQRFVADPNRNAPQRYYLVLSDGRHCTWAIVPPLSETEASIDAGSLEIGCIVTVVDYVVVAAKCGKNVLVLLDVSYSMTPFSLIGTPMVHPVWVPLSSQSLVRRAAAAVVLGAGGRSSKGSFTDCMFADFLPVDGVVLLDPMDRWAVVGRVLWKSKLRRLDAGLNNQRSSGRRGDAVDGAPEPQPSRFVFDCVMVDANGDAMKLIFWGCRSHFDLVVPGDCCRVCDGSVKRNEEQQPMWLQFQERSVIEHVVTEAAASDCSDAASAIPHKPNRLIGVCAVPFLSVSEVQQQNGIGDVVTVQGVVANIQACNQIRTVRGNVDKMSVTLRDTKVPAATIDITLWDEAARLCQASPGQLWCFRDVVVRFFGSAKQLSTRASSEAFELPTTYLDSADPSALFRVQPRKAPTVVNISSSQRERVHKPSGVDEDDKAAAPHHQSLTFFFDFEDARSSESVYILVKIQRIKTPLFYVACTMCGGQMRGLACLSCSSTATELRFLLRVDMSDGLNSHTAVGFTPVAEALFGTTTKSFLAQASSDASFSRTAVADIIGLPILVKMVRTVEGISHIVDLKHVDLVKASAALLSAIASYDAS